MTEATEAQRDAYKNQWQALDDRSRHAVILVQVAHQFLCLFESGRTPEQIAFMFSGTRNPEYPLDFTPAEIQFAIVAAMQAREQALRSLAEKVYNREGIAEALAKYQVGNEATALEQLKAVKDNG
jgi:hypothetical protein